MSVVIKRIYDTPSLEDGFRVLVDRLWPRGISKEKAKLDLWLKDIAPGPELRIWFGHDPEKFKEFSKRYKFELDNNSAVGELTKILKQHKNVILLYGAKDPQINHAVVLKEYIRKFEA
jgi:uncharacterized protein YeaO (DUF488 family)